MSRVISEELYDASLLELERQKAIELGALNKSLWKKIAKNEIILRTSRFRGHRVIFFVVLYGFLSIWSFALAPMLFDLFMPQLAEAEALSGIFVPMIGTIIESLMMMFFLVVMMYPLNVVYRKAEIGFKETLLASPVTEGDVFLGEFLGKMPVYSAAVLIFAPIIIGLANPIVNFNFINYLAIYGCVFGLLFFANLVGSILASWIEHKISQNEKARDLGKALAMVLSILMVVIMYALMYFLQFLMEHPELRNWLNFYPSLWYSNVIQHFMEPALLDAYVLNIWTSIILALGVPIVVLFVSYKKASIFYTLEGGLETSGSIIENENIFYKIIRRITGRKWGGLITTQFKGFMRKKANLARLAYVIGLVGFFGWFFSLNIEDSGEALFMTTFIIVMGGMMFSIMLGHLIFIDSKDLLWVYKRSPRGVSGLIYSYVITMLILIIVIAAPLTIFIMYIFKLELFDAAFLFVSFTLYSLISLCQAVAIQCFSPAFEEKGKSMQGNVIISMMLQNIPLFTMIFLLMGFLTVSPELERLFVTGILFLINTMITIPMLIVGMKKLDQIE